TSRTGCWSKATGLWYSDRVVRPNAASRRRRRTRGTSGDTLTPPSAIKEGSGMLQRFFGVSIGAIITFLLLKFFITSDGFRIVGDENQAYLWAAIIGAVASFFWPIV